MKNKGKYFLFTLIAVLTPFLLLESAARMISHPGSYNYIEKRMIEQGFRPRKGAEEFRIFLFGESTMHGSHLYPESTIATWLRLYLDNLLDDDTAKRISVYNFGRLGVTSRFISQAFIDTLCYQPDLVVFYTAHNDFILLDKRKELLAETFPQKCNLFFKNLIKKSSFVSAINRTVIKNKLKAEKKNTDGKIYDDNWYDHEKRKIYVYEVARMDPASADFQTLGTIWENNVRKIIEAARKNKVPIIFYKGLARYNTFDPFVSIHDPALTEEELEKWEKLNSGAEELLQKKYYDKALSLFQKCLEIDRTYAQTYFQIGLCYEKLGDLTSAKKFYRLANDKDFALIRGPSRVNKFYDQLEQEDHRQVYYIETQEIFEKSSPNGMIDSTLIIDQLHPTMQGQSLMALEVCKILYNNDLFAGKDQWRWERLRDFKSLRQSITINEDFRFKALLYSASYVGSYYDKAIIFLNEALRIHPESLAARSQLAWTYWETGRRKEAVRIYRELTSEFPIKARRFFKKNPRIAEIVKE